MIIDIDDITLPAPVTVCDVLSYDVIDEVRFMMSKVSYDVRV